MAGSGVIPLVALSLGRSAIYQDINQRAFEIYQEKLKASGLDVVKKSEKDNETENEDENPPIWHTGRVADALEGVLISMKARPNLILTSPPFGLVIDAVHDGFSDNPHDIGNVDTYEIWRISMKQIMMHCLGALVPGGLMIIETRPRSQKGVSYHLNAWVTMDAIELGFEFFSEIIEIFPPWRMWTSGAEDQRKPFPMHSYLTMLRKPDDPNEKLELI